MIKKSSAGRNRGRPAGYKMREESKRAISSSKIGQKHKQDTKDKISRTLTIYFRKLHPLSEEITKRYSLINDDALNYWIDSNKDNLDNVEDVRTERSMRNSRKIEIAYGSNI